MKRTMGEAFGSRNLALSLAALLALLGISLQVTVFYPGSLSPDSWNQYEEGKSGLYSDWHPPFMAFTWRILDAIWTGPTGMLAFHLAIFWTALFLFWKHLTQRSPWLSTLVPTISLLPTTVGLIGVIWKDIGTAACGLLAASCLLTPTKGRPYRIAIVLLTIAYAAAVRRNGIFLVAPMVWLVLSDLMKPLFTPSQRAYRLLAAGILTPVSGLALLYTISTLERNWLYATQRHIEQSIMLHDLASISQKTGLDKTPIEFRTPVYSASSLSAALADVRCSDNCIYGQSAPYAVTSNPVALAALKQAWLSEIAAHPRIYLQHRLTLWEGLLGWGFPDCRTKHFFFAKEFDAQFADSAYWQDIYQKAIDWMGGHTPFFKTWFWLVVGFLSLVTIELTGDQWMQRTSVVPLAAMSYSAGYFPSTVCCDFRYVWVVPILAMISALLALDSCGRKRLKNRGDHPENFPDSLP